MATFYAYDIVDCSDCTAGDEQSFVVVAEGPFDEFEGDYYQVADVDDGVICIELAGGRCQSHTC